MDCLVWEDFATIYQRRYREELEIVKYYNQDDAVLG